MRLTQELGRQTAHFTHALFFRPIVKENRTQSGALWRIEGEKRAKKMRQDDGAEFISASLAYEYKSACTVPDDTAVLG